MLYHCCFIEMYEAILVGLFEKKKINTGQVIPSLLSYACLKEWLHFCFNQYFKHRAAPVTKIKKKNWINKCFHWTSNFHAFLCKSWNLSEHKDLAIIQQAESTIKSQRMGRFCDDVFSSWHVQMNGQSEQYIICGRFEWISSFFFVFNGTRWPCICMQCPLIKWRASFLCHITIPLLIDCEQLERNPKHPLTCGGTNISLLKLALIKN